MADPDVTQHNYHNPIRAQTAKGMGVGVSGGWQLCGLKSWGRCQAGCRQRPSLHTGGLAWSAAAWLACWKRRPFRVTDGCPGQSEEPLVPVTPKEGRSSQQVGQAAASSAQAPHPAPHPRRWAPARWRRGPAACSSALEGAPACPGQPGSRPGSSRGGTERIPPPERLIRVPREAAWAFGSQMVAEGWVPQAHSGPSTVHQNWRQQVQRAV